MHSTIYTIHGHNDSRVARVMGEMTTAGAPRIRVVDCGDHYMAIEGTHRLEAACRLEIAPDLDVLARDDLVALSGLDLDWLVAGEIYTAGEIAAEVYNNGAGCYRRESDGRLHLVFNGRNVPADVST